MSASTGSETLLDIRDLVTEIVRGGQRLRPVDGVTFSIARGETVGLVGESGSGKTMVANSILRLLPSEARITGGSVVFQGQDLRHARPEAIRDIRGKDIGMIFQNPMTSLNPRMAIGYQVAEGVRRHRGVGKRAARERAVEMLDLVGLPNPTQRYDEFPHRLSGGLRQRVMIAMALACDPALLIADEPTTALDVTIQAEILDLVDRLKRELGMAVLMVTHDMAVIAGRADRVLVMYAGQIVEEGSATAVLEDARHRYSEALLNSIPTLKHDPDQRLLSIPGRPPDLGDYGAGCRFAPRCAHSDDDCLASLPEPALFAAGHRAACLHPAGGPVQRSLAAPGAAQRADPAPVADVPAPLETRASAYERSAVPVLRLAGVGRVYRMRVASGLRRRGEQLRAVHDVSFEVWPGQTLGIVGESGSGKSTLARMIVGLESPTSGEVWFKGAQLATLGRRARRRLRRGMQLMFQDSHSALDPRMRVGAIIAEPMVIQHDGDRGARAERVARILHDVGMSHDATLSRPHEFSGGQRQRINLARALVLRPDLIVADEPVSALDASVRSQVLNLMKDVQRGTDLAYIVISHDLAVVRYLADRVGVMFNGRLVELGDREAIYTRAGHPYTQRLLAAVPSLGSQALPYPAGTHRDEGILRSGQGCSFVAYCAQAQEICHAVEPVLELRGADAHRVACHFPLTGG